MKKIAVLGGGGTGHAVAADLTLSGHEICLFEEPRLKESLDPILERGGIEIKGMANQGHAKIAGMTTDIEEALGDAEIIMVAMPAMRHEAIAEICAPHIKDGQAIVIAPGNAGGFVFANVFKDKSVKNDVTICELERNFYLCRLTGPAEVMVALSGGDRYMSAFPANDSERVVEVLKDVYDVIPAKNILEVTLNNPNIRCHVPGSILNTGAIEKSSGDFYLFKGNVTPSVSRCVEAMFKEKVAIFDALGYTVRPTPEGAKRVESSKAFQSLIGPTSMKHRYITEDVAVGQALLNSLGEMFNIPTPVINSFVTLASVINETDYMKEGKTVENLRIAGLTADQLNNYLAEGQI